MAYISEHISWREATFSKTANKKEIDNTPSQNVVVQMKKTAKMIFEPCNLDNTSMIVLDGPYAAHGMRKISKDVEIEGFRKGKVPLNIVKLRHFL